MSQALVIALVTAVMNGLVTWGVVSTKLEWMRKDIDRIEHRLERCEAKQ